MKYCFGADVGGTTIKLGLFTVDGEILDKWEIITRTENEGESILPDIAAALKEKTQEKAIQAEEVIGIGMGIPAPVNSSTISISLEFRRKRIWLNQGFLTEISIKKL